MGNVGRTQKMPQKPIIEVVIFDMCDINFMALFLPSYVNKYVPVVVHYVSKWVEAIALPTKESKHVPRFLHGNIFAMFGYP